MDKQINPVECEYHEFVALLAKPMKGQVEDMLHMAIGMAGECAEFLGALLTGDLMNMREELGDWDFYWQGMNNIWGFGLDERNATKQDWFSSDVATYAKIRPLDNGWMWKVATGDLLDHVKKCWVYNRSVDTVLFCGLLARCEFYYVNLLAERNWDRVAIRAENREKLLKSYEGGKYSDAAANERKDKILQEEIAATQAERAAEIAAESRVED